MAVRTTPVAVRAIIDSDSSLDVSSFIDTANVVTDYVQSQDSSGLLTTAMLRQIETYLAAHYYAIRDQQYRSKKTGDASAEFQVGMAGQRPFELNDWGRQAMALDITGTLAKINAGNKTVSFTWLGKPVSEQTAYEDRD